jgi:hypothetical protein
MPPIDLSQIKKYFDGVVAPLEQVEITSLTPKSKEGLWSMEYAERVAGWYRKNNLASQTRDEFTRNIGAYTGSIPSFFPAIKAEVRRQHLGSQKALWSMQVEGHDRDSRIANRIFCIGLLVSKNGNSPRSSLRSCRLRIAVVAESGTFVAQASYRVRFGGYGGASSRGRMLAA